MAPSLANATFQNIAYSTKLDVVRDLGNGMTTQQVASKYGTNFEVIRRISAQKETIEAPPKPKQKRRNLTIAEKIRVLHYIRKEDAPNDIARRFGISPRTVRRIRKDSEAILSMEESSGTIHARRPLTPKYPEIDDAVLKFCNFVRGQRLPLTLELIRQRARMAATALGISGFKAARGYVYRFLRRSGLQPSLTLHGHGSTLPPEDHVAHMEEIRRVTMEYSASNIYNMDESGLFFRMGPRKSYLLQSEIRSEARGTKLQKNKNRVTTVYCVNADGSHKLPMKYIGKSVQPVCFDLHPTARFSYMSQSKGWMDANTFETWLHFWYAEVQTRSVGPWLLIMDNCSGHDLDFNLPNVRIECLPPNTTPLYQPLDLGLIAQTKIRYRMSLLRHIINMTLQWQQEDHGFKENSGRGKYGLREGHSPHVADAISLMNEAWEYVSQRNVCKCWIKSKCLHDMHVFTLQQAIGNIDSSLTYTAAESSHGLSATENPELSQAITTDEAEGISDAYTAATVLNVPDTPVAQFLLDVSGCVSPQQFVEAICTPVPGDDIRLQSMESDQEIHSLYSESLNPAPNSNAREAFEEKKAECIADLDALIQKIDDLIIDEHLSSIFKEAKQCLQNK